MPFPDLLKESREHMGYIHSLIIGTYENDPLGKITIAAINDTLGLDDLRLIFDECYKSPIEIQKTILSMYEDTGSPRFLHAYNELAIRAERINRDKGNEFYPISETYPEFERLKSACPGFSLCRRWLESVVA